MEASPNITHRLRFGGWPLRWAAVGLGVLQAGVCVVAAVVAAVSGSPGGAVGLIVFAMVILAGVWLASEQPALMGYVLVVGGAVMALFVAGVIEWGKSWSENPGPWGFWEFFAIVMVGGVPVLAGILLLLSATSMAWSSDRAERRAQRQRLAEIEARRHLRNTH